MNFTAVRLLFASAAILGFASSAQAQSVTVSPEVQKQCEWDYHQFCSQYGLGTQLLDICFRQNGPKMSKGCIDALIAAGDVSQEYVTRQKELLGK